MVAIERYRAFISVSAVAGVVLVTVFLGAAVSGDADVVKATASQDGSGNWSFRVTVQHADEGWDHYANKWEVVAPDGAVLATRVLHHPHVDEQPFTRSLSGVTLPDGIETVTIRAGDSVHGIGGRAQIVNLAP